MYECVRATYVCAYIHAVIRVCLSVTLDKGWPEPYSYMYVSCMHICARYYSGEMIKPSVMYSMYKHGSGQPYT